METTYTIYTLTFKTPDGKAFYVGCTKQPLNKRLMSAHYGKSRIGQFIRQHGITTQDLRNAAKHYTTTSRSEESRQLAYMKAQHPDWECLNTAPCMFTNSHAESLVAEKATIRRTSGRLMKARYANDSEFKEKHKARMRAVMRSKSLYTKSKYSMSYTAAVRHGLWTREDAEAWKTYEI